MIGETYQNQTDQFLHQAAEELRPIYISDEARAQVEAAGCSIQGVQYFRELFAVREAVDTDDRIEDKLASVFVGCTAQGKPELAERAFDLLFDTVEYTEATEIWLVNLLGLAAREEHRQGRVTRAQYLRTASKTLHKKYEDGLKRHQQYLAQPLGETVTSLAVVAQQAA